MLFSHVKVSRLCAKPRVLFHWCLYDEMLRRVVPANIHNPPPSLFPEKGFLTLRQEERGVSDKQTKYKGNRGSQ